MDYMQEAVSTDYNCGECGQFTPEMDFTDYEVIEGDAVISCPNCGGGSKAVTLVSYMPS